MDYRNVYRGGNFTFTRDRTQFSIPVNIRFDDHCREDEENETAGKDETLVSNPSPTRAGTYIHESLRSGGMRNTNPEELLDGGVERVTLQVLQRRMDFCDIEKAGGVKTAGGRPMSERPPHLRTDLQFCSSDSVCLPGSDRSGRVTEYRSTPSLQSA